jgi:hypothetical protein
MNSRTYSNEFVENPAHGAKTQDARDTTATTRDSKKDPIAHLYAEYVHALLSHPKIERRRQKR